MTKRPASPIPKETKRCRSLASHLTDLSASVVSIAALFIADRQGELEEKLAAAQAETDAMQERYEKECSLLAENLTAMEEKAHHDDKTLRAVIATMTVDKAELNDRVASLEKALNAAKGRRQASDSAGLKNEITKLQNKITSLQMSLEFNNLTAKAAEDRNNALTNENAALKVDLEGWQAEASALRARAGSAAVRDLRRELEWYKAETELLRKDNAGLYNSLDSVRDEVASLQRANQHLKDEAGRLRAERETANAALETARQRQEQEEANQAALSKAKDTFDGAYHLLSAALKDANICDEHSSARSNQ